MADSENGNLAEQAGLIPRFSIKHLLMLFVGLAMVSACFAGAARGNVVGLGFSVSLGLLLVVFLVHGAVFWLCYLISGRIFRRNPSGHLATAEPAIEAQLVLDSPGVSPEADSSKQSGEQID